jgi:hypothetical protein
MLCVMDYGRSRARALRWGQDLWTSDPLAADAS